MKNNLMFYIKTTETCNLDCSHCYTSGSNGRKIFFDPIKVANWVNHFAEGRSVHFEFHGGEPFLAPISDMREFYNRTKDVWNHPSYGCTSNLVIKLTDERLSFMEEVLGKRIGTSWDPNIRFSNEKQRQLWESNVRQLLNDGYNIKVFVTLTRDVVDMEPIRLLEYFRDLGVQELAIERLTHNGSADQNLHIFPSNLELQYWMYNMHQQSVEHNAREWLENEFLETIYDKFEKGFNASGTFCRDCEQKLFTINADGTIAGCPNSAPTDFYATLDDHPETIEINTKRCGIIAKEASRDPRCYECDVFKYCNGDCHQLEWQDDICAAPKLLMRELKNGSKQQYI